MTLTAGPADAGSDIAEAPPSRCSRRRTVVLGLVAFLVLAAAAAGLSWWRYAATYDPLRTGNAFGPYPNQTHNALGYDEEHDRYVLRGEPGATGAWLFLMANDGAHDVTITELGGGPAVGTRWSPYVFVDGGAVSGEFRSLQPFPATVPAHGTIRVVLTYRKPVCARHDPGTSTTVTARWHALGVNHAITLDAFAGQWFGARPESLPD